MKRAKLCIVNLTVCVCLLSQGLFAAQGTKPAALPPVAYGTWIWSPESTIDPALSRYKCYVERLEALENGRSRFREHRIRDTGAVVKNDFQFEVGDEMSRGNITYSYKLTGPRSYQTILRTKGEITFVVTREISADGRTMTHVGEGLVGGQRVRNEQVFHRSEGPARSGECSVE